MASTASSSAQLKSSETALATLSATWQITTSITEIALNARQTMLSTVTCVFASVSTRILMMALAMGSALTWIQGYLRTKVIAKSAQSEER
jgi:hypothetical protein